MEKKRGGRLRGEKARKGIGGKDEDGEPNKENVRKGESMICEISYQAYRVGEGVGERRTSKERVEGEP